VQRRRVLKKMERGNKLQFFDSCKFPTEEIWVLKISILPQSPPKVGFPALNLALNANFSTRRKSATTTFPRVKI